MKKTMALLETGQMKCPWSEDEIKNVLHGEPWEGVSYTGARTRNPLCPPPPARAPPLVLPGNVTSIRRVGLANSEDMHEKQKQFQAYTNSFGSNVEDLIGDIPVRKKQKSSKKSAPTESDDGVY